MAAMDLDRQVAYRSEIWRTPTDELPQLVDRMLDRSTTRHIAMTFEEQEELPKGQVRPSRSLFAVVRRLLERGESEHRVLTASVGKAVTVPDDSDMSLPCGGSADLLTD